MINYREAKEIIFIMHWLLLNREIKLTMKPPTKTIFLPAYQHIQLQSLFLIIYIPNQNTISWILCWLFSVSIFSKKERTKKMHNAHICILESRTNALFVVASGLLKVQHRVSHSKHQVRQGGTNGCNLGSSMAISSPLWNKFVFNILMDDRPFDNPSFSWRWDKWHGYSFLWTRSPKQSSSVDMAWDKYHSWSAQSRCHIARQNSIAHHCLKT